MTELEYMNTVCVCVRERERERVCVCAWKVTELEYLNTLCLCVCLCVCVCVCVCVWLIVEDLDQARTLIGFSEAISHFNLKMIFVKNWEIVYDKKANFNYLDSQYGLTITLTLTFSLMAATSSQFIERE